MICSSNNLLKSVCRWVCVLKKTFRWRSSSARYILRFGYTAFVHSCRKQSTLGVRLARSFDRLIREPLLDSMQHGRWTAQTVHDVNVDSENRSARAQSEDGRVESYGNRIEIDREPRVLTRALLASISFKRRRKSTPCVLTRGQIFARLLF